MKPAGSIGHAELMGTAPGGSSRPIPGAIEAGQPIYQARFAPAAASLAVIHSSCGPKSGTSSGPSWGRRDMRRELSLES